ncbi:MAG: hypothetical protein BWZ04_03201 [Firmicutes bacterium ADurb.BinA205]|nr:MAG: hypothetical protein BWZ04_03201 [Firmicutes bacterium ADurb.BinA205]
MYTYINTLHILTPEILVEIIGHSAVAVDFIAVPLAVGTHVHMRVLICCCDVCDTAETDILRLAADHLRGNRLSVLPVAADVSGIAECMLSGTAALNSLIVRRTSEAGSHNDLGAVQGGIELFELFHKLIADLKLMFFPALAAELFCIKMRGKLCGIRILIFLVHFLFLSA